MRFATVKADGSIFSILEAENIETLAMNIPADCEAHACPDRAVTPDTHRYSAGAFTAIPAPVLTIAEVEDLLVAQVKGEGERRRMLVMSPGGSKKTVYSLKQSEVDTWNDLGSTLATQLTAALGLSPLKQKRKFRFAMAEAALRGEPNAAAAIARFAKGSDDANAEAARVEAIEQAGVAAIKAATTITAKRAAYAAINWNWTA